MTPTELDLSSSEAALIAERLRRTQERIAEAALRSCRAPESVRLIAVTKTQPLAAILAAWDAGQQAFGENRPEEGAEKIVEVTARRPDCRPQWHLIGRIQRRKCPLVIAHFDVVHAVDRTELAERLSRLAVEAGRCLPILLECNISGEASKAGFALTGWEHEPEALAAFLGEVEHIQGLPGLRLEGLMTIAPLVEDAEQTRPVFASLRALRDLLRERCPNAAWAELSMGMTDDFEVAIEEGATMVRIGRAIFGERR